MPDGWAMSTVGEVCQMVKRGRAPLYADEGLLVISQKCVREENRLDLDPARCTDVDNRPVPEWSLVRAGDTLVASTGRGTLGRAAFVSSLPVDATVDSHVTIVRPLPELVVPAFLGLVLSSMRAELEAYGSGSTNQTELSREAISNISFRLPPLGVQRRVVDLVDAVDTARAEAQRLAERSVAAENAIRSTVMDELLATQSTRLAEVVQVTNGRQRSPKHAQGDHMHRYVRAANVKDGALVLDEPMFMNFTPQEQVRYRLVPGDVLVTEGCGSRSQIGASCQWAGEIEGVVCFQNHLLRLRTKDEAALPQRFVYQWALWAFRTGVFAEIATGTNIFSLGTGRVSELSFPRAEPTAFRQALGILEEAEHHSKAAIAEADALSRLRSALLGELLSGEREIPGSYDDLVGLVA